MMTLPRISKALSRSSCPILMESWVEAPIPTNEPKAAPRFISGMVIPNPDKASGPTPCPMKMLSIRLYSDAAVMAMIAGMA